MAGREYQRQFAAVGAVEESGRRAGARGVQLEESSEIEALEAESQSAGGIGRVVDAVLVADKARTVSTQIEKLIPIGAIAGQPGDVVGEYNAHLFMVNESHKFLEPGPPFSTTTGAPNVGVDHPNEARVPASGAGSVLEVILEPETFLIRQGLVRSRLADVDDGEATEVIGVNGLGYAHGMPP